MRAFCTCEFGGDPLCRVHGTQDLVPASEADALREENERLKHALKAKSLGQVHELRLNDLREVTEERDAARQRLGELEEALAEAAIPLEVLDGLGNSFVIKRARRDYDRLISAELRQQITEAVSRIRSALTPTEDKEAE